MSGHRSDGLSGFPQLFSFSDSRPQDPTEDQESRSNRNSFLKKNFKLPFLPFLLFDLGRRTKPVLSNADQPKPLFPARAHEGGQGLRLSRIVQRVDRFAPCGFHELVIAHEIPDA